MGVTNKDRIIISTQDDLKALRSVSSQEIGFKPIGLWYAFGRAWKDYIDDMYFSTRKGGHFYKIRVNSSRIIKLDSEKAVIDFEAEYGERFPNPKYMFREEDRIGRQYPLDINWVKVAKQYDGIEFNPYNYGWSSNSGWYRTVDVPSGCVWKSRAVIDITKIDPFN